MSISLPVTFATGAGKLDRAAHLRGATAALLADPAAQVLPIWQGRPMFSLTDGWPMLGWVPVLPRTLAMADEAPVFLGLIEGVPSFAADFSGQEDDVLRKALMPGAKFIDLRSVAGELDSVAAATAATAKAVLGWHQTHGFCARCGRRTGPEQGGWRRRCDGCGSLHFPRIDPVVIMLVLHGDKVLLGRQSAWPPGMHSLLAGFMEPGETIDDAVRREVLEETGVPVGRVRYLTCQPWPFPSSLMLGCVAEALATEITLDPEELEDALWLNRSELPEVLAGRHHRLASPRVDAIARVLLAAWVDGEISI